MHILGISAHYHDAAAALVSDGVPVAAVQEERLSRRKNDASFPMLAIEWCLDQAGLAPEQLDAVVFYEKPMLKFERILTMGLRSFPRSWRSFPKAMKNALAEKLWIKGIIAGQLGISASKILFTEHHQSHAAAAFLTAPTRRAAILTADGVGEWATLTIGTGEKRDDGGTSIKLLREIRFPHSLGMLYSTFTAYLGFPVNEGEYKVMGLASYGTPRFADVVRRIVRPAADGAFSLDLDWFEFHAGAQRAWSDKLIDALGPPRGPHEPLDPGTPEGARCADIAASVQLVLEETLISLTQALHEETDLDDLCLGGGVALNGCANAKILARSGFARLFVPSAPGDAGCALGAALYADRIHFQRPHLDVPDHPYWGPDLDDGSALSRLAAEDGLPCAQLGNDDEIVDDLQRGRIIGFLHGRAEYGPRALANRSILAAPGPAAMRDRLNRSIKYREEFRPFAPAVPIEEAHRYFDLPPGAERLGRHMSGVFPVRLEYRERLAAVTHVDGTARVQTVERAMAPRFWALLQAYGARTGIPVLLNTSFNLAGEPIVTSAAEGYSTFRRSGIDSLVAGTTIVRKAAAGQREEAVA